MYTNHSNVAPYLFGSTAVATDFPSSCTIGDLEVDFSRYAAQRGDEEVKFTALEWNLLRYLVARRGETVSRKDLLREVWKQPAATKTRAIDIAMHKLRRKIEVDPKRPYYLLTIYGKGYQLVDEDTYVF